MKLALLQDFSFQISRRVTIDGVHDTKNKRILLKTLTKT